MPAITTSACKPLDAFHLPASLSTLPAELVLRILENFQVTRDQSRDHLNTSLDQITSTCLGLTCKALYSIHKAIFPTPIKLSCESGFPKEFSLATRLRDWMPRGFVYNDLMGKFVTVERGEEIYREAERKEVERWKSMAGKGITGAWEW